MGPLAGDLSTVPSHQPPDSRVDPALAAPAFHHDAFDPSPLRDALALEHRKIGRHHAGPATDKALDVLRRAGPAERFQSLVWNMEKGANQLSDAEETAVRDLALDLDYFTADPQGPTNNAAVLQRVRNEISTVLAVFRKSSK